MVFGNIILCLGQFTKKLDVTPQAIHSAILGSSRRSSGNSGKNHHYNLCHHPNFRQCHNLHHLHHLCFQQATNHDQGHDNSDDNDDDDNGNNDNHNNDNGNYDDKDDVWTDDNDAYVRSQWSEVERRQRRQRWQLHVLPGWMSSSSFSFSSSSWPCYQCHAAGASLGASHDPRKLSRESLQGGLVHDINSNLVAPGKMTMMMMMMTMMITMMIMMIMTRISARRPCPWYQ